MLSQKLALKSFQVNGSEFGAIFLDDKLLGCIGAEGDSKDFIYIPCKFCSHTVCEIRRSWPEYCYPDNSSIHRD